MSDIDIKSALEIAMEKVEKLSSATEEERLRWEYVPEGEKLAARYLKEDANLVLELKKYPENAKKYVMEGIQEILIRNLNMPNDDIGKKRNRQAMDALKTLKSDKVGVENIYSAMRRIFEHYQKQGDQQRKQAYEELKKQFEERIQTTIQQQLGSFVRYKVDVERQPQFQEEWRRIQSQLDSQYTMLLADYKRQLKVLT